ncbi:hypothetical protein CDD83_3631 [Cordyceps sp. RAO-2017]|nr:hypothetical protein CDD83_3631 [Cordyceps sp. RAO-2017]
MPVDAAHGLWRFFPAPGKLLWTPREAEQHGRAWTVEELRRKSWEDLHALWWRCCRERNLLATSLAELRRAKLGFGDKEFANRDAEILRTMSSVKHALTERFYTWQDAADVARSDPEIDLAAPDGQVYRPAAVEEDEDGAGADGAWPSEAGPAPETEPETAARAGLSDKEAVR